MRKKKRKEEKEKKKKPRKIEMCCLFPTKFKTKVGLFGEE